MKTNSKSRYNCAFCLTPITKGHFERQNGKCQRCNHFFPDAMPFQNICTEFGCTEFSEIGKEYCVMHGEKLNNNNHQDVRYNIPKKHHGISKEAIDAAIDSNAIYKEVRDVLPDEETREAHREQVAYGMTKYPELLNPMSWSMVESLDHKIQEQVDALQYTVMHKHQLIKYLKENKIEKA